MQHKNSFFACAIFSIYKGSKTHNLTKLFAVKFSNKHSKS